MLQYPWARAACGNIGQLTYLLTTNMLFRLEWLLQVQLKPDEPRSRMWSLPGALKDMITPSDRFRLESPLFLVVQWLVSCGTIVYIIFGAFLFSTTQFLDMD